VEAIGMFDAKTRFSEIVRRVKATGQPVLITSRGEEMVRIVPVDGPGDSKRRMTRDEAIAAMLELRKTLPVTTHEENRADIQEGRR